MNKMLKLRYFLRASGSPEDLDLDASAHPGDTKYQGIEASSHNEVHEDVPEGLEVTAAGSIDERNTQKTLEYIGTMDLDVANID